MSSDTPLYRDAEGLQVVDREEFPEAVTGQPEAAGLLQTHIEDHGPEAVSEEHESAYEKYATVVVSGFAEDEKPPPEYAHDGPPTRERRILGMRRKVFIWVAVAAGAVIIIAAVLGGVLGTVLHRHSSDSEATTPVWVAEDQTSLAILNPYGTDDIYTYYIDSAGNIVEAYSAGKDLTWSLSTPTEFTSITASATEGSPIAAIAFSANGTSWRQLFFVDTSGKLATTTLLEGEWRTPYNPLLVDGENMMQAVADSKTNALSAIVDTNSDALNGIRVYLGVTQAGQSYIQEVGMDFSESPVTNPVWHWWHGFSDSDPLSGVSAVLNNNSNHVYFRNTSTGGLQPWTWNYADDSYTWEICASSESPNLVSPGSAMAAVSDPTSGTDFIFYQSSSSPNIATSDGTTVRVQHTAAAGFTGFDTNIADLQLSPLPYPLAALWWCVNNTYDDRILGEGPIVFSQNASGSAFLLFDQISSSGQTELYIWDTSSPPAEGSS